MSVDLVFLVQLESNDELVKELKTIITKVDMWRTYYAHKNMLAYSSTFSIWATSVEYLIKFNFSALALRKEF